MKTKNKLLFLIFIILQQSIFSQNTIDLSLELEKKHLPFGLSKNVPVKNPVVSLALSGGGSRAIAHVGVLKALNENNLKVDHVIGTSMGSVIGGLYSSGYSIVEIDSIINSIVWDELFFITGEERSDLFVDQKITEDKSLLTVRMDGFSPVIPQSISTGNKIANLLISLNINSPLNNISDFNKLLFKYRAVATELVTGDRIVIKNGSLSEAMRASSSVSFLLPPIKKDSMMLVDGGLVDNLPIKSARELNPDFIIASDATSSLRSKEELVYPWEIADQIVSIPSRKILVESRKDADLLITHDLQNRKNDDFSDLKSLIHIGYENTKNRIEQITEEIKNRFIKKIAPTDITFENIRIPDKPNIIEKAISQKFRDKSKIKKSEILFEISQLINSGNYEYITGKITDELNPMVSFEYKVNPIVKSLNLEGISKVPLTSANEIFSGLLERPFNADSTLTAALSLIRLYRKNSFSSSNIDSIIFTDDEELVVYFNEGLISDVIIEGAENTLPSIIKREFPTLPGNYLRVDELNNGLKNLSATDLFENIGANIDKDSSENNILKLNLIEKIPNVLRFGLRIDNENFTQAAVDIRNENLFGGGSELGFSLAGGSRNISAILEHKTNRIFNTYLTYKAQAFYKHNDVNIYAEDNSTEVKRFSRSRIAEYRQRFYGGFIGIGSHLKRLGTLTAEAKYEVNEIDNLFAFPSDAEYKLNITSFKFRLQIDSQNKYPYPTKGIYINTYYETAQKLLGGDVSYAKFSFDYQGFFTLGKKHTFIPKLVFGFADETLPLSQHFEFGGQFNFLGYRDYEFRGRQILISSLEYRYKIPIDIFFDTYFKIRYDLGSSWLEQEQIRFKNLRHGIGITLSFDTPIGPADFSVGRSLLLQDTSPERILSRGPFMFYFTIGYYY
jgi:NTE family protein